MFAALRRASVGLSVFDLHRFFPCRAPRGTWLREGLDERFVLSLNFGFFLVSFWITFCLRSRSVKSFPNSAIPSLSGFSGGWSVIRHRLDSVMDVLRNVR